MKSAGKLPLSSLALPPHPHTITSWSRRAEEHPSLCLHSKQQDEGEEQTGNKRVIHTSESAPSK